MKEWRLPSGEYTDDVNKCVEEWDEAVKRVERIFSAKVYSSNPGFGVASNEGVGTFELPCWALDEVVSYTDGITEKALEAVDAEPELEGDMPDELWEMLVNSVNCCDREGVCDVFRAAVRSTKKGIRERILSMRGDV